ncbi:MAG: peptidylprolyl isomerase [Myxococcota bacterium]
MSREDLCIAIVLVGMATGLLLAGGCEGGREAAVIAERPAFEAPAPQPGLREVAVLEVRDLGEIRVELLAEAAPDTVVHFKKLVEDGFYEGTTFHRVIPEFMIQGGDPNTRDRDPRNDGQGGPGYFIQDEVNETSHVRGVLSMANSGSPNSAGSQFFIVVETSAHLDGRYSAFGLVVDGMEVADRIAAAPRDLYGRHGPVDRPLEDVVIESIRIETPQTLGRAEAGPEEEA